MGKKVEAKAKEDEFECTRKMVDEDYEALIKRRAIREQTEMFQDTKLPTFQASQMAEVLFDTLLENELAFKVYNKYLQVNQLEGVWKFFKLLQDFEDHYDDCSFDENNEKMNEAMKYFQDKKVMEVLTSSSMEAVNFCITRGKHKKSMFNDIKLLMDHRVKMSDFEAFKRSKYAQEYLGTVLKLDDLVKDQHLMVYFEMFMASEYSHENINFYDRASKYKKNWNPENPEINLEKAIYILRLYVSQESPCQINIPAKMRVRIERKILREKVATEDLFDHARREIYGLMKKDAWPRFRKSKFWTQCLNAIPEKDEKMNAFDLRQYIFLEYLGMDSMEKVIKSKTGREFFGKYLQVLKEKDGSMAFYDELNQFRNNKEQGPMEMELNAQALFGKFLDEGAFFPVNIPEEIVEELRTKVQGEVSLDMFDEALRKMLKGLIKNNSFNRFRFTGLYTNYRLLSSGK